MYLGFGLVHGVDFIKVYFQYLSPENLPINWYWPFYTHQSIQENKNGSSHSHISCHSSPIDPHHDKDVQNHGNLFFNPTPQLSPNSLQFNHVPTNLLQVPLLLRLHNQLKSSEALQLRPLSGPKCGTQHLLHRVEAVQEEGTDALRGVGGQGLHREHQELHRRAQTVRECHEQFGGCGHGVPVG